MIKKAHFLHHSLEVNITAQKLIQGGWVGGWFPARVGQIWALSSGVYPYLGDPPLKIEHFDIL